MPDWLGVSHNPARKIALQTGMLGLRDGVNRARKPVSDIKNVGREGGYCVKFVRRVNKEGGRLFAHETLAIYTRLL
jgi:hypothetical protein